MNIQQSMERLQGAIAKKFSAENSEATIAVEWDDLEQCARVTIRCEQFEDQEMLISRDAALYDPGRKIVAQETYKRWYRAGYGHACITPPTPQPQGGLREYLTKMFGWKKAG